jgi:hypothetical protein
LGDDAPEIVEERNETDDQDDALPFVEHQDSNKEFKK